MKKLFVICVIAVSTMLFAQTAQAGRFGIKGGANVTSLDFKNGLPGAVGYSAGITWQWNLPLWFAIQPDLLYHVNASTLDEAGSMLSMGTVELVPNIQWGPRIANNNVRIFAQASPFVGYAVNKNFAGADEGMDESVSAAFGANDWTNINRLSYGCGLGVGVQLWFLQVTAQYVWNFGAVTNIKEFSTSMFNDTTFSGYNITLALMFGGKKNKTTK